MIENDDNPRMTKPTLDLYPLVKMPAFPPTWADVEQLARDYPQVRQAVALVARGEWTREQALIMLLHIYLDAWQRAFHAEVDRRSREMPDRIVLPPEYR